MSRKRILIVDDEEDLLFGIKIHLVARDFEVLTAADGQTGLEIARAQKPDLIILDLMLPRIDGYKVCRMLKFDEKYKRIPIILFSALAQESDREMGLEVGADDYLVKPFNADLLLSKIAELLGGGV